MASKTVIRITGRAREIVEDGDWAFWIYVDDRAVQCAPKKGHEVVTPTLQAGQLITLEGEFTDELHIPEFPLFRFQRVELQPISPIVSVDIDAARYTSPV